MSHQVIFVLAVAAIWTLYYHSGHGGVSIGDGFTTSVLPNLFSFERSEAMPQWNCRVAEFPGLLRDDSFAIGNNVWLGLECCCCWRNDRRRLFREAEFGHLGNGTEELCSRRKSGIKDKSTF